MLRSYIHLYLLLNSIWFIYLILYKNRNKILTFSTAICYLKVVNTSYFSAATRILLRVLSCFVFYELLVESGGGVWGVFLTSVLMLMFWPTGWVMLRRLRIKLNHPSRTSRFPNVGESAMSSGVPLLCLSLYLGTQSLSCLVYEGVTDCALKNSGGLEGGRMAG